MTINGTTTADFNRANDLMEHGRPECGEEGLALRWADSKHFKGWLEVFLRVGVEPHVAGSILSAGIELGYNLRRALEGE